MRNIRFVVVALAAACTPPAPKAPPGPVALDSTAARAAVEAVSAQYRDKAIAGDPAGLAALFTEDATATFFGSPTTSGRANIQALYTAAFAAGKATREEIAVGTANGSVPGMITALGTSLEAQDSAGTAITNYYRWAAVFRQGTDSQWRFSYVMAFPDSTTRK